MSLLKQYKLAERALARQQEIISELEGLTNSIERCEKTIHDLKTELEAVNLKHQNRKTTQDDIDYLTDLLKCANKKLNWEKQLASLQKRTPALLQNICALMADAKHPPGEQMRCSLVEALHRVQAAMERLEQGRAG
jgi:predicted  nucleic acid-binding Zn-ribbon protein